MEDLRGYIVEQKNILVARKLQSEPALLNAHDGDGRTPLMWALSETQNLETVSEVLKAARDYDKFDIDASDDAGYTALHIAASIGEQFVALLLPFKPTIDCRTNARQTPLFLAVSKQQINTVKLLLENKASARTKDSRQVSVLMRAAAIGSQQLVELLLDAGAPVNATDASGWSALHYAYAEDHMNIVQILEERGADSSLESRDGELPKDVAPRKY